MTDAKPVFERIEGYVQGDPVVLFMKGTPVFPQCGFSAQVVQVLSHLGVKFKAYDVLSDDELRQGIKEFSSWPTIPQLYVKGEFVGGCDIVREMYQSGELGQLLEQQGIGTHAAA
jgi:monothiol glutaredoxin